MLIRVYVTPNAREARVVKVSDDYFEVRVDERAVQKIENLHSKRNKNKKQARPSNSRTHS